MGGLAFLIMLGGFAVLLYWYITNLERGNDGTLGLLGLKCEDTPAAALGPGERRYGKKYSPAAIDTGDASAEEAKWHPKEPGKAYKPVD